MITLTSNPCPVSGGSTTKSFDRRALTLKLRGWNHLINDETVTDGCRVLSTHTLAESVPPSVLVGVVAQFEVLGVDLARQFYRRAPGISTGPVRKPRNDMRDCWRDQ